MAKAPRRDVLAGLNPRRRRPRFTFAATNNFGVDFRGGDLVTLSAPHKVDVAQVRDALKPIGLADASIQQSPQGDKSYITIRGPLNTSDKIESQILQSLPKMRIQGAGVRTRRGIGRR